MRGWQRAQGQDVVARRVIQPKETSGPARQKKKIKLPWQRLVNHAARSPGDTSF
jgi:hypothetical protein